MLSPRIFLILPLLLVFYHPCWADELYPNNRAGEIAAAFFAAFNGSVEDFREFSLNYRDQASMERTDIDTRVARYQAMKGQVGTLEPHSIRSATEGSISIVAHASTPDMWVLVDLTLEDDEPFKLASMAVQPTGDPNRGPLFGEWKDHQDLLDQAVESSGTPAIVAAEIVDGEIKYTVAAGQRSVQDETPIEIDDRFHIGSVTKSMTAMLIARLVEDGKLSWDDTIADHLGGVQMRDEYRTVTLRDLASHRAGLPAWTSVSPGDDSRMKAVPGQPGQRRNALCKEVLQQEPIARPGSSMNYSNAGYTLLGHIAERKARKSWESLIESTVFVPLDMSTGGFGWPQTAARLDEPRGHMGDPPNLMVTDEDSYLVGDYLAPAGDVHASVQDVARYALLHLRGMRGEDDVLLATTIQDQHADPDGDGYGGGWVIDTSADGQEQHWHNGSAGSFFAVVRIVPEKNWGGVVLMNTGSFANQQICDQLLEAMYERAD